MIKRAIKRKGLADGSWKSTKDLLWIFLEDAKRMFWMFLETVLHEKCSTSRFYRASSIGMRQRDPNSIFRIQFPELNWAISKRLSCSEHESESIWSRGDSLCELFTKVTLPELTFHFKVRVLTLDTNVKCRSEKSKIRRQKFIWH